MNPDLQFKLNLYQNSPDVFNDDELDLLKTQLESAGADKSIIDGVQHAGPKRDGNFSLGRTLGNFLEGTVEGATTLDTGITDPQNSVEEIARGLGSLGGFVGGFLLPGGLIAKGLRAGSKGLKGLKVLESSKRAQQVADIGERAAKSIESSKLFRRVDPVTGEVTTGNMIPIWSVPKMGSQAVLKYLGNTAKAQEMMKSYKWLQKGTTSEAIAHEAINLGLMSVISTMTINPANWRENIDNAMGSFISGGALGGAFGGIGNYVKISQALKSSNPATKKAADTAVKAMAGALVQGIAMHASHEEGAEIPLEMQAYEYMLGAYFGAKAQTGRQRAVEANKMKVREALTKDIPIEETLKDSKLTKEVQSDLKQMYETQISSKKLAEKLRADMMGEKYYDPLDWYDIRITAGPNKGKEGKLIESDAKWAYYETTDGKQTKVLHKNMEYKKPTETEFQRGETIFDNAIQEQIDLQDNIDLHRPTNTYINKSVERAAFELQKQSIDIGKPLTRLEINSRLQEILKGKSDYNWNSIAADLEAKFPELGIVDMSKGSNLNELGQQLRRYAKSQQNRQSVRMIHLNFNKQGPVLEEYGTLNAKGQVVANKKKTVPKWVGVREEDFVSNVRTDPSDYKGVSVKRVGSIKTDKKVPVAARLTDTGIIINRSLLKKKFKDKAWTKPAEQKDGSKAEPLERKQFKNYDEFESFVIEHEFQHTNIKKNKNESIGEYETRINNEALKNVLETNYKKQLKEPVTKLKKGVFSYNEIGTREGSWFSKKRDRWESAVSKLFREQDLYNSGWLTPANKKINFKTEDARYRHIKKTRQLYEQGHFILGGSGEKDTIVHTDLQFSVKPNVRDRNAPRNYLLTATKGYPKLQKTIAENREFFINLHKLTRQRKGADLDALFDAKYAYENMVASKMMWLENLNGKSFKHMMDANKKAVKEGRKKPYIDNIVELNKRFPVIHAGEPALDPAMYEGLPNVENGNLKVVLANAIPKSKAGYEKIISKELGGKELDAHRDGIYILRQDIFDSLIMDAGLPINVGSAKGTLLTKNGDKGLMLGKYAYARASNEVNSEMKREGYHGELYDTSIKQLGERELYDLTLQKNKNRYVNSKGENKGISVVFEEIPITDHRLNLGVYENPTKNLSNQTSALQRWEWAFSPYLKDSKLTHKEMQEYFTELTKENFQGSSKINELLKREGELSEAELLNIQKTDIDNISVNEVLRIAGSHKDSPVYRMMWDKLHRRFNEVLDVASKGDMVDVETQDAVAEYLNIRSMSDKILKAAPNLTPLTINHKWASRYTDLVLRNYLLRRVNKPKEELSSKHILMPYDRFAQTNKLTANLQPGEFIMYRDAARAKIKVGSETMSIEKAWHELNTKFLSSTKADKARTRMLEDALEQVLLRVPADNISGQRLVKIKAILKERGTGVIVHPEDMHFLGGADLDIDSVFMYRNTPKKMKDAIRDNKYVMKDNEPTGKDAQAKYGSKYIAGKSTKDVLSNPAYMLDPFFSEQVGNSSRVNNINLGIAVSQGQLLGRALDYAQSNPKKEYKLNLSKQALKKLVGVELVEPVLLLESKANLKKYMEEVQKAVNMYADAGKFGQLIGKDRLMESLWNDSGLSVSIKDKKTGFIQPIVDYGKAKAIFNSSVFGASHAFKQSLGGVKYVDGVRKQMTINETRDAGLEYLKRLEESNIDPTEMPGVLSVKARYLTEFADNMNYMGNVSPEKLVKLIQKAEELSDQNNILASYNKHAKIKRLKKETDKQYADRLRDMISNDIDFVVTVAKLDKNLKKAEEILGEAESKALKNEVIDAASELKFSWQMEKSQNFNKKRITKAGTVQLTDIVNKNIKTVADSYLNDYIDSPFLTPEQAIQAGKLKQELFYDMLSSNVIMGVNQKKQVLFNMARNRYAQALGQLKGATSVKNELIPAYEKFLKDKLGSLADGQGINLDMLYSADSIPFQYLNKHFALREKVEDQLQRRTKDPMAEILSDQPAKTPETKIAQEQRKQIREKIRGYKEGKAKQEWLDSLDQQVSDSQQLREMKEDLTAIFEQHPNIMANLERVFPTMVNRPYATSLIDNVFGVSLKNATVSDMNQFIGWFKNRMSAEDWVKFKKGDPLAKKMYTSAFLQFPETIVNKVGPFDITLFEVKGGKVYEDGKLVEKKDLLVPMSGFEKLTTDNKMASEVATGLTDQFNNKWLKSKFDWLESVQGGNERLLIEAAWGIVEQPMINKVQPKHRKTYEDGYQKSLDILKNIGDKKFSATYNGKTREVKGKVLVDKVAKDLQDMMTWVDKNILHTEVPFSDFIVRDGSGVPSIRQTIQRNIQPVLRQNKFREKITDKDVTLNKHISNDNLFKLLELWKRSEKAIKHKGEVVLNRDFREIDSNKYTQWVEEQIRDIDANYGVGRITEGYLPHRNIPKRIVEEAIEAQMKKSGNVSKGMETLLNQEIVLGDLGRQDGGAMRQFNNVILHQGDRGAHRIGSYDKTAQTLSPNQQRRSAHLPEYEKSINTLAQYSSQLIKARYNALMALSNSETIRAFENKRLKDGTPVMGSEQNRSHWGRFMRLTTLKDVGGQHILPETWLNDKNFPINPAYKGFTEGQLHKRLKKIGKFFKDENMFLPVDAQGNATPEVLSDRLNWLSNLEARVSTSTLLFNTRGWVYNMTGGTANTMISAGINPLMKAYDYKYLRSIIPDPNLKKGQPDNRGKNEFLNWAKEHGVIETFWTSELAGNPAFRELKGQKGFDGFFKEMKEAVSDSMWGTDKKADKRNIIETAKKYDLDTKASNLGGWFMKKAETELRLRSFLAHYIKAREVFAARGSTFERDDPALIKIALEGTVGSQYLYNNVSRPMFTASPAGRIMTRFQLWAGNSMRKRKDIVNMAANNGFKQGSEEFKKFERMMGADMMMFAMASLLPYSMFDATLPPPYNYYQEMSQMLYGTPQEKERAFFGQLPYPLNITGLITPPSARFIVQPVGN